MVAVSSWYSVRVTATLSVAARVTVAGPVYQPLVTGPLTDAAVTGASVSPEPGAVSRK